MSKYPASVLLLLSLTILIAAGCNPEINAGSGSSEDSSTGSDSSAQDQAPATDTDNPTADDSSDAVSDTGVDSGSAGNNGDSGSDSSSSDTGNDSSDSNSGNDSSSSDASSSGSDNSSSDASSSGSDNSSSDTACTTLDQRWKQTLVTVDATASPIDEYTPAIIAPLAGGESLLAWSDQNSDNIGLMTLDGNDQKVATLPSLPGLEVHDALATHDGYALAVMANDPDIYSSKYCRGDATPGNAVCGKMDLVLLNSLGEQTARTTLTQKANVDSNGAHFIWWYGHTARLATDGNTIAVYFRSAGSYTRPSDANEIDIHAGDTLKFADASTATLINGGWDWGCSHSWSVRLANNGYNWSAVCHGDAYPNAMRMARMNVLNSPSYLTWLDNSDPTQRALGGLVAGNDGFWMNYIETVDSNLTLKLAKFEDALSSMDQSITITSATNLDNSYPFRAYMTEYGDGQLLLGWKSNGKLVIASADAGTGDILEGPVTTDLSIDNFQDIKTSADGDVIWAYSDGGTNQIKVNRIAACHL